MKDIDGSAVEKKEDDEDSSSGSEEEAMEDIDDLLSKKINLIKTSTSDAVEVSDFFLFVKNSDRTTYYNP